MAITISGENNNDRILASDGVLDSISGINAVGVVTATSFTGDLIGDVTGNLTGNVTGNINNSTLLLQTGGTERLRITSNGNIGAGTNNPDGFYTHAKNLVIGSGSSGEGITIFSGSSDSGYIGFNDTVSNGMQGFIQYNHNGDYMAFGPNGTEKVRITSGGIFKMPDNGAIHLGGSQSGVGDLRIFHDGSNSYIKESGAGDLYITNGSDNSIIAKTNGAVELYWDNVKKFETYQYGIKSPGHIVASSDGYGFYAGAGFDIEMLHDGSNSRIKNVTGNLEFQEHTSSGDIIFKTTTSGSERLRITSSGKVGINESTPLGNLHVKSSDSGATVGTSADELVLESSANTGMTILSGTTSEGAINFGDSGDNNIGKIVYVHDGNYMYFKTNDTERLRITSEGYVRIGGAIGNFPLNVIDESNRTTTAVPTIGLYAKHDGSGNTGVGFGGGINFWGDRNGDNARQTMGRIFCVADVNSGTNISGALTFETSTAGTPTEKLRISSAGQVSIPVSGKLTVGPTNNAPARFTVGPTNGSTNIEIEEYGVIRGYNRNSSAWSKIEFEASHYVFDTDGGEKFRITSGGRVGINETSPDGMLHLKGSVPAIYLEDSDGTYGQAIIEQNGDNLKIRQDAGNASSGSSSNIRFEVDGSERMRIENLGDNEYGAKFFNNKAIEFKSQDQGIFTNTWSISANTWTNFFSIPSYFQAWIFLNSTHNAGNSSALWSVSKSLSGGSTATRLAYDNAYGPATVDLRINGVWVQLKSSYATYGYAIINCCAGGNGVANLSG